MSDLVQRRKAMGEEMMRDAICAAATTVLAEVGFTALTMERVAEATGVSKGTLYNYFQDKDALFLEVIDRAFAVVAAAVDQAMAKDDSPRAKLTRVVRLLLSGLEAHRGLGQAVCSSELSPRLDEALRGKQMRMRKHFATILHEAQATGALRDDSQDPEALSRLLAMTIDGVVDERMLHGEECPPLEDEVATIEAMVLRHWFREARR